MSKKKSPADIALRAAALANSAVDDNRLGNDDRQPVWDAIELLERFAARVRHLDR